MRARSWRSAYSPGAPGSRSVVIQSRRPYPKAPPTPSDILSEARQRTFHDYYQAVVGGELLFWQEGVEVLMTAKWLEIGILLHVCQVAETAGNSSLEKIDGLPFIVLHRLLALFRGKLLIVSDHGYARCGRAGGVVQVARILCILGPF